MQYLQCFTEEKLHFPLHPETLTTLMGLAQVEVTLERRMISRNSIWHVHMCLLSHYTHTHTHTHLMSLFSGTTRINRYQKGGTNLDFTEARDSEWQWHQLGHMQVCTSLKTDNQASTPPLSFFYRPVALTATQPTASKCWRLLLSHYCLVNKQYIFFVLRTWVSFSTSCWIGWKMHSAWSVYQLHQQGLNSLICMHFTQLFASFCTACQISLKSVQWFS